MSVNKSSVWTLDLTQETAQANEIEFDFKQACNVISHPPEAFVLDPYVGLLGFIPDPASRLLLCEQNPTFRPCQATGLCTTLGKFFVCLSNSASKCVQMLQSPKEWRTICLLDETPSSIVEIGPGVLLVCCQKSIVRIDLSSDHRLAQQRTLCYAPTTMWWVDMTFCKQTQRVFLLDSIQASIWVYCLHFPDQSPFPLDIKVNLQNPLGIAAQSITHDTTRLYVSDSGHKRIIRITVTASLATQHDNWVYSTPDVPKNISVDENGYNLVYSSYVHLNPPDSLLYAISQFYDKQNGLLEYNPNETATDQQIGNILKLTETLLQALIGYSTTHSAYYSLAVSTLAKASYYFECLKTQSPRVQALQILMTKFLIPTNDSRYPPQKQHIAKEMHYLGDPPRIGSVVWYNSNKSICSSNYHAQLTPSGNQANLSVISWDPAITLRVTGSSLQITKLAVWGVVFAIVEKPAFDLQSSVVYYTVVTQSSTLVAKIVPESELTFQSEHIHVIGRLVSHKIFSEQDVPPDIYFDVGEAVVVIELLPFGYSNSVKFVQQFLRQEAALNSDSSTAPKRTLNVESDIERGLSRLARIIRGPNTNTVPKHSVGPYFLTQIRPLSAKKCVDAMCCAFNDSSLYVGYANGKIYGWKKNGKKLFKVKAFKKPVQQIVCTNDQVWAVSSDQRVEINARSGRRYYCNKAEPVKKRCLVKVNNQIWEGISDFANKGKICVWNLALPTKTLIATITFDSYVSYLHWNESKHTVLAAGYGVIVEYNASTFCKLHRYQVGSQHISKFQPYQQNFLVFNHKSPEAIQYWKGGSRKPKKMFPIPGLQPDTDNPSDNATSKPGHPGKSTSSEPSVDPDNKSSKKKELSELWDMKVEGDFLIFCHKSDIIFWHLGLWSAPGELVLEKETNFTQIFSTGMSNSLGIVSHNNLYTWKLKENK